MANIKKSYQWLEKAILKDSTEQVLRTRSIEAGVTHTAGPKFQIVQCGPRDIQHTIEGCSQL